MACTLNWPCVNSHSLSVWQMLLYLVIISIFIMDLSIYDAHIIHCNMNPLQSVALGWSYFTHLDYLVICCWIWATLLHPTIITPAGAPNVWRYVQLFEGVVGYMLNGATCYHIVVIFHSLFPHITSIISFFFKHHFRTILQSIDSTYISTVRWVSFCYCSSVIPSLGPAAYPPWPGPDYFWPTIRLTMCHVSMFFVPPWFSTLGTVGLSSPYAWS